MDKLPKNLRTKKRGSKNVITLNCQKCHKVLAIITTEVKGIEIKCPKCNKINKF